MKMAIAEAYRGIRSYHGGPFGTVIVKDGVVVGRGHNKVIKKNDPTCHGEMEAIRNACKKLKTYNLSGCELYTTAEPCPMCLGAILWANISVVYYGCTKTDTDKIGFRDERFYDFLNGKENLVSLTEKERESCLALFKDYSADKKNTLY